MNLARYADRAQRNGVPRRTFYDRVSRGKSAEEASIPFVAKGRSRRVRRGWSEWESSVIPSGIGRKRFYRWLSEADDISDEHKDGFLFKGVEV